MYEAYGTRQPKRVKHKNRKLKRLQQERRHVAQVERRLSVAKINKMLNGLSGMSVIRPYW